MGAYVSSVLVMTYGVSFWWSIPAAGIFAAVASLLIGLPILRLRGVYFAMVSLVLTEVTRLLALALPITSGAKGITNIPLPGGISIFGLTIVPDFNTMENPRIAFYYLAVILMVLCFMRHVPACSFAHRAHLHVASAKRGVGLFNWRQHCKLAPYRRCRLVFPRRRQRFGYSRQ